MFPGIPARLCNEGIKQFTRHGLKTCEKTLYNARKLIIIANMDYYHLPLPVMNGYFKQVTPSKAISDAESGEYLLNILTEFKKNGCKIFVIEYNPVDNCRMAPVWDLFSNSGEMRNGSNLWSQGQVQVILPPGECDSNLVSNQCRYCKHHINYSSKVHYSQYRSVINLDHLVTLVMTNSFRPPHSVSTLHHKYF
jgi:hypothetical protein